MITWLFILLQWRADYSADIILQTLRQLRAVLNAKYKARLVRPSQHWVHVRRVQGQTGTASHENSDKRVQRKFYCTVPSPKPNFYHNSNHCPCIYLSTDLDESLKFACFHCTQMSLFPTAAAPVLPRSCLTGIATLHMS